MSRQQMIFALILILGSVISLILTALKRRRLRGQRLVADFGQPPNPKDFDEDTLPHIKEYWRLMRAPDHQGSQVDDITWGDLDMDAMAVRDQIKDGDSYFVVEIKSLRRILSAISQERFLLCFIDEILRGTNTIERIASSAALLSYLNSQPVLCMAATHDIELTQLLSDYQQFHFREEMTDKGMVFPYRLMEGPSTTRNAIRLLEMMDFPASVTKRADNLAAHFTDTGSWEK